MDEIEFNPLACGFAIVLLLFMHYIIRWRLVEIFSVNSSEEVLLIIVHCKYKDVSFAAKQLTDERGQ